jgi:hypothetical protein
MPAFCCFNPNADGQGQKNASQNITFVFAVLTLMLKGKAKNASQNMTFVFCCFN